VATSKCIIDVFMSLGGRNVPAGTLVFACSRGQTSCSFSYSETWLAMPGAFELDPSLPLVPGFAHVPQKQEMHGCFADSCPDRWGRNLLRRHCLKNGLPAPGPADFLLGVADASRSGAFRFRLQDSQEWLSPQATGVPKAKTLSEFAAIVRAYEKDGLDSDFKDLLVPGTSLGGARPKLSLESPRDGSLWMAKFPSLNDEEDVCLLEKLNYDAATACGIAVPETRLYRLKTGRHILLSRRFDRRQGPDGTVLRIPYASAMTLLGARDGSSEEYSYADLAMAMQEQGGEPATSCRELWRRELFNVLAGNRDDHLRNHGFLRHADGWRPSPAFDLECAKGKRTHALALNVEGCTEPDMEAVLAAAEWFGIAPRDALADARRFAETVSLFSGRNFCLDRGLSASDRAALEESRDGVRWPEFFAGERIRRGTASLQDGQAGSTTANADAGSRPEPGPVPASDAKDEPEEEAGPQPGM